MPHQQDNPYTPLQTGAVFEFANHKLVCIDQLGEGGFGIVYKVQEVELPKRYFALKPSDGARQRGEKEIFGIAHRNMLSGIKGLIMSTQPHIINILPEIQDNDVRFLMPLCGTNVDDLVYSHPEMWRTMQTRSLLRQMLQALDYLVSGDPGFSFVHRDLKPANILLKMGSTVMEPHFILAGFGRCHDTIGEIKPETWIGTRNWMAPEIAINQGLLQTPKADIWSLFVTVQWCHSKKFRTLMFYGGMELIEGI
ncbi:kinase-like domain-containing protein [Xylariaceae sp. FL1019]|nr:kinase-like domain-containing protein [Xylariaceae sp. FL1019]